MLYKSRDISKISGDDLIDMITNLLAQPETIKLIIENGDNNVI